MSGLRTLVGVLDLVLFAGLYLGYLVFAFRSGRASAQVPLEDQD